MSKAKFEEFLQNGGESVDGVTPESDANTSFTTDPFEISNQYSWALQTSLSGTDDYATINIEASNDASNWDTLPNGENIPVLSDDSYTLFDQFFPFKYLRIVYNHGAITEGKVKMFLILK